MASQVLSGASNASYTNNTGQNVRLIINYMSNVTSMTWAGVTVTASSTTIGKDIQNINLTGELRQAVRGTQLSNPDFGLYRLTVNTAEISPNKATIHTYTPTSPLNYSGPIILPATDTRVAVPLPTNGPGNTNSFSSIVPKRLSSSADTIDGIQNLPNLFYVPTGGTIARGGDFPVELMLSNGQSFSSVCGAYNAIVIKEDGT